jgi:hypothetical protein
LPTLFLLLQILFVGVYLDTTPCMFYTEIWLVWNHNTFLFSGCVCPLVPFVGLAYYYYQGKDIVFRFIIEYYSIPYGILAPTRWTMICFPQFFLFFDKWIEFFLEIYIFLFTYLFNLIFNF